MEYLHRQYLRHFAEQDVIAGMEADLDELDADVLGHLRVVIAFADLVGFVRFTEEEGEEQALDLIERFVEAVEASLPDDARVVKNIGDGVMIVGTDPAALVDWALGFQEGFPSGRGRGSASTTATPSIETGTTTEERQSRRSGGFARAGRRGALTEPVYDGSHRTQSQLRANR